MTKYLDFQTLRLEPKPNSCLLAPPGHCLDASPHLSAPVLQYQAAELYSKLKHIINSNKRWKHVETDDDSMRIKFVAVTKIMKFKDDVDIQVIENSANESSLAVYSRSRVGYSDMGANRKRVETIVSGLGAKPL